MCGLQPHQEAYTIESNLQNPVYIFMRTNTFCAANNYTGWCWAASLAGQPTLQWAGWPMHPAGQTIGLHGAL